MNRYRGNTRDADITPASNRGQFYNYYLPERQPDEELTWRLRQAAERRPRTGVNNASTSSSASPADGYQSQQQQPVQHRSQLATAVFTPSPVHRLSAGQVNDRENYSSMICILYTGDVPYVT